MEQNTLNKENIQTFLKQFKTSYPNNVYTEFYGMASKKGQKDMFGKKRKTAEGKSKFIKVTTTLPQWTENMIAYLKSAK